MCIKAVRRFVLPVGIGLVTVWLVVAGLRAAQAQSTPPQAPLALAAVDRPQDPVVVPGASFPAFSGASLDDLVLYAYRSGAWTPIPFQIDEVNITGTYVISDGGLLDADDELVFMAGDAGDSVSAAIWPADAQSRLYSRYAITVTDPLSTGGQAWVYLYRSATLTPSGVSYITWTESAQTAEAISYTAAFSPTVFVGLSDLFINGRSVDILDRQKIRALIPIPFFPLTITEEFLASSAAPLNLPAVGPVRAVTNDGDLNAAFYGSRIDFDVTFDLSDLGAFLPDFIRTSFDWNNPITTGITTYYDSNTVGAVTINGVPDVVSTTPPINWFQVNGGAAGPGGVVMAIPNVDPGGGTVSNYYKDNSAVDPNDTGDQRSYGDAGLRIDNPGTVISFTLVAYVLPPGTATNVGATYFDRANNPLTTAAAEQCFTPSGAGCLRIHRVYLSSMSRNFCGVTIADPGFTFQPDMVQINADDAWVQCVLGNPSIVVAIIDTGVALSHPDLVANLIPGYDYVDNDAVPEDGNGHGTNVAGIAGAALDGNGVVGVAPRTRLLPVRVLNNQGSGTTSAVAAGINYAADNAHILNLSLGTIFPNSTLQSAIAYAVNTKGRLVVAAAGNCGDPATFDLNGCDFVDQENYPAAYSTSFPNVMAVAAVNGSDQQASFSNQGAYVTIAAPGVGIYNTFTNPQYKSVSGTSQAAPHVAGLAALVSARNPTYSAAQVRTAIETTAVDLGSAGRDIQYGWGRIDVVPAVGLSSMVPTAAQADSTHAELLPPPDNREAEFVPGRVLIKFRPGAGAASIDRALGAFGGVSVEGQIGRLDIHVLRVPVGQEWQLIDQLRALPDVEFAEPDYIIRLYPDQSSP